jgi:membrane protein DedA with SNARE-associated domain
LAEIANLLAGIAALVGSNPIIPYSIIFSILILCGLGLPVPEDIVLIAAGLFAYNGDASLYGMILISLLGVILGDYMLFFIGRRWGLWFLTHRIFKGAFSEKRIMKVHKYFDKYGNKTVFFARFLLGVRAATFFIAGTHTMSAIKFIALDLLGALISIPLIIYLAYHFGGEIEHGVTIIRHTNHTILAIVAICIAFLIIRYRLRKKQY